MFKLSKQKNKGFTLIELLVVIAIIAILSAVVFVALDPATRFADARNSRRWSDVNTLLTAVHKCVVDNGGDLDLSTNLAKYLASMPQDPDTGTAADTGYSIQLDANNIVTVTADDAENSETVQVSR